jgi:hypothetical protein
VPCGTELSRNVLAFGAANHKFLLVLRLIVQIVRVNIATVFLCRHRLGVMPCKHVEGALLWLNSWVEAAEVEAVEVTIEIHGGNAFFSVLSSFSSEFSGDYKTWRAEIAILVNFDAVHIFGVGLRDQTQAVLFVVAKTDALDAVFGGLKPRELLNGLASLSANDEQVFSGILWVVLFTTHNIAVAR